MAQVELQCGPFRVVSLMSSDAVADLGLELGSVAVAVVKSTTVIIETPQGGVMKRLSPRALAAVAAARAVAACGSGSSDRSGRAPSGASTPDTTLTGVRRGLADSTFTELGKEFEAAHPGAKVELQLRWLLRPGRPDPAGRPGRRVRVGRHQEHGKLAADDWSTATPGELRVEHPGDRRPAGQPGRGRPRCGPREARRQGRASARPRCPAVRRRRRSSSHRGRHQAGQRGAVGHRRTEQGRVRGGRRRAGLRHRREGAPATRSRASPSPSRRRP